MLIFLIILWSMIDLLVTITYSNHPAFYEINPIMRYFLDSNIYDMILIKIFITIMSVYIIAKFLPKTRKPYIYIIKYGFCGLVYIWLYYWVCFLIAIKG